MKLTEEIFLNLDGKANNLFDKLSVNTYLEIGVREGTTFIKRVPKVQHAVAIDCWDLFTRPSQNDMNRSKSEALSQYTSLLARHKDNKNVSIYKAFSNDTTVLNMFDYGYFDVIFIDGDHSYEGVKEDLNNWWNKCNTLFCGHDYMLQPVKWNGVECGVKTAVDEFVLENSNNIHKFSVNTQSNNPTWFIWKRTELI